MTIVNHTSIPKLAGWITTEETAQRLGITKQAIHKQIVAGAFESVRAIGSKPFYVISTQEVEDARQRRLGKKVPVGHDPTAAMNHDNCYRISQVQVDGAAIACTAVLCMCGLLFSKDKTWQAHRAKPDAPKVRCDHCTMVENRNPNHGHQVGMGAHIHDRHPENGVGPKDYHIVPNHDAGW